MENINIYNQYMYSYPHKNVYKKQEKQTIKNALINIDNTNISLYFHIPFCSSKCGYCNLFSVTNKDLINDYVDNMCNQIIEYKEYLINKNIKIDNIIFGGGTPTILSEDNFKKIFNILEKEYNILIKDIGFDIETSPKETDIKKMKFLKQSGMNRISIGVQSFNEEELKSLKRYHDVNSCEKAIKVLKDTEVKILNIDLIYGIENQSKDSLTKSLEKAISFDPEEIFIYPLYERNLLKGSKFVSDEEKLELYKYAQKFLKSKNYYQTSMRRFVKKLDVNISSCGFENTISFGCGGRSYIQNIHFCEEYKTKTVECNYLIKNYINKKDFTEDMYGYILDKEEISRRFIIKNIGYFKGINEEEYNILFEEDLYTKYKHIFNDLSEKGLILRDKGNIKLTEKGFGYSDYILPLWISEKIQGELSFD